MFPHLLSAQLSFIKNYFYLHLKLHPCWLHPVLTPPTSSFFPLDLIFPFFSVILRFTNSSLYVCLLLASPPYFTLIPTTSRWWPKRMQVPASRMSSSITIRMCGSQSPAASVCVTAGRFCAMKLSARRSKSAPALSSHLESAAPSARLMPVRPLVVIYLFTHP